MIATPTCQEFSQRVIEFKHGVLRSRDTADSLAWEQLVSGQALDRLPVGLAFFSGDFVLLKCNQTYADYLTLHTAYDREKALGMSYFDYKPGVERYTLDWLRHVRESGRSDTRYDVELCWQGKGGQEHVSYWDVHLAPVTGPNQRTEGLLMCCIDATETHLVKCQLGAQDYAHAVKFRQVEDLKQGIRAILALREEDKTLAQDRCVANARQMLLPWIEKLKQSPLNAEQEVYLKVIETNLAKLASPFCQKLAAANKALTPTEIQVANLVELGKLSKEIAELLRVSKECVDFHRHNIRRKLGLTGIKANLKTYLSAIGR